MIQKVGPEDIYPSILDLLKDLRAQNIKIALASASKMVHSFLKRWS